MLEPVVLVGGRFVESPWPIDFSVEAFDLAHDWIVLRFDPRDVQLDPVALDPRGALEGRRWASYGFPLKSRTGMAIEGSLTSIAAQYPGTGPSKGVIALQLECDQAGFGQEIPGFSGAPVWVDDRVVGFIRSTPMDDAGKTVGATIYAMPIISVAQRLGLAVPSAPRRAAGQGRESPLEHELCFDRKEYKLAFAQRFDVWRKLPTLVPIAGDDSQLHEDFSRYCQHRITLGLEPHEILELPPLTWPSPGEQIDTALGTLRETLARALTRVLRPESEFEQLRAAATSLAALCTDLLMGAEQSGARGVFVRHRIYSPGPPDQELLAVYLEQIWARAPVELAGTFEFYLPRASFWDRLLRRRPSNIVERCTSTLQSFMLNRGGPRLDSIVLESPTLEEILEETLKYGPKLPKDRVQRMYEDTAGNMSELKKRIRGMIDG
jgi:hypothetical protein